MYAGVSEAEKRVREGGREEGERERGRKRQREYQCPMSHTMG